MPNGQSSCELGNRLLFEPPSSSECDNENSLTQNTYPACAVHYGSDSCLPYRGRNDSPQTLLDRMGSWQRCWAYGPNPSKTTFTDPVMLLDESLTKAQDASLNVVIAGAVILPVMAAYFVLRRYVQSAGITFPCTCCNRCFAQAGKWS